MAAIALDAVSKTFASVGAVREVSLALESGRFLTLLGPSGCGKSTTLRLIAGLLTPDSGRVSIDGRDVTRVPTHRRGIGMVFQNLALFPHMTVAQNVAFGLRMQGVARPERATRVAEALALVQLGGLDARLPRQLSGGQQQRVALARALVTRPAVLLLDEPFAALDRKLRLEMQEELRELIRRTGTTAVFVTHDQEEALVLSDRIAVMSGGRIEQIDRPQVVFERPASAFVADFMGVANLLAGTVVACDGGRATIRIDGLAAPLVAACDAPAGAAVTVALRPEAIRLAAAAPPAPGVGLAVTVERVVYQGTTATCRLRPEPDGPALVARAVLPAGGTLPAEGAPAWASWDPAALHVMRR